MPYKAIQITIFLLFTTLSFTTSLGEESLNDFEVVQSYLLDQPEFTEGLYFDQDNNRIIESTGLEGDSEMRTWRFDDEDGRITDIQTLFMDDPELFGEGTTMLNGHYYQLSYHNAQIIIFHEENIGSEEDRLVVDRIAAQPRDDDCHLPEGWGLTADEQYLYMSDGSNRIFRIVPEDLVDYTDGYESQDFGEDCPSEYLFDQIYYISDDHDSPINNINELELVGSYIYANIWLTNDVIRMRIEEDDITYDRSYDFTVLREITCDRVLQEYHREECDRAIDVLNGIAYDQSNSQFIMTGKEWPVVFRLTINDNTAI